MGGDRGRARLGTRQKLRGSATACPADSATPEARGQTQSRLASHQARRNPAGNRLHDGRGKERVRVMPEHAPRGAAPGSDEPIPIRFGRLPREAR